MLNPIEINFKLDKTIKRALTTELMIKSHDINVIEFHISFDGLELTADHSVKVLSVFNDTESQTNINCDIVDGKAIYRPDTSIISQYEYVQNYVYLYHGEQSLDVREFRYSVDLSKIDETALKVKEVYDQSYNDLLENFEQALTDYKDALPQASDLRAEINVVLNQFGVDSQAKLNQYDTDAQQVIADNQTTFNLAESNRQSTYEQAEDSRNQVSEQAVVDWEQGADALVDNKLSEIQTDADALINGSIDDFNQRGDAEIADWRDEKSGELASLHTEIEKKANRKQEEWITPTLLNGAITPPDNPLGYMKDEMGFVHFKGRVKATPGVVSLTVASGYNFSLQQGVTKKFSASTFDARSTADIQINYVGQIFITAANSDVWVHLDGIHYKAGD